MLGVVAPGAASLFALIVAVPLLSAVTIIVVPADVLTELDAFGARTAGLLETQFTVRPESGLPPPSFGVAIRVCVPPTTIEVVGEDSVTVATGTGLTVTVGVGPELTVSLVAVIVALPTPTAVTVAGDPAALTINTAVLLDAHAIGRPVSTLPFASLVVAVSCCV